MLTVDTVLYRVPDLTIKIDTSNLMRLHHGGRVLKLGPEAMSVLDVLHTPCSISELIRRVDPRLVGRRTTEQTIATVRMLHEAGVLITEPEPGFSRTPTPSYDSSFVHLTILNDTARKGAFVRAVRELVGPGDVVLDLGTGSGVLAVAAAQAGAEHVYAVEPAAMVHTAELVAGGNGVADRITFIRGWSSQLELPRKANVLTTDIVGNEALDMVIWETVQDARERLLTPDARLLPCALRGMTSLVTLPSEVQACHRLDQSQLDRWRAAYGIDFTPLHTVSSPHPIGFYERPDVARQWPVLSAPHQLYLLDLHAPPASIDEKVTVTADRDGMANGVVVFFDAQLSPSVSFSSAPWQGGPASHWFTAVWSLPELLPVRAGASVDLRFRYHGEGHTQLDVIEATKPDRSDRHGTA